MEKKTKMILIVTGSIVAAYAGYKLFFSPAAPITPTNGGGGTNSSTTNSGLNFVDLADKLFTAFNGCGTDNNTWRSVLSQLKNQSDWDALSKAYGTRTITCIITFWDNYTGGLQGAFRSELSDSELGEANATLASKNISSL